MIFWLLAIKETSPIIHNIDAECTKEYSHLTVTVLIPRAAPSFTHRGFSNLHATPAELPWPVEPPLSTWSLEEVDGCR